MFGFLRGHGPRSDTGALGRRQVLRLGGISAAGVAGAALVSALDASPAAAGTDGDVLLSADNVGNGESRTALIDDIAKTEILGAFQNARSGAAVRGRGGRDSTEFPWSKNKAGSYGVWGESRDGTGVSGVSDSGAGVAGRSSVGAGVAGSSQNGSGVGGTSYFGAGVFGSSRNGTGVTGNNYVGTGVDASSLYGTGVDASSQHGNALRAHTDDATTGAAAAVVTHAGLGPGLTVSTTANATAPALQATSGGAPPAVEAIGAAVPTGGAVAAAGNGAALSVQGVAAFTRSGAVTLVASAASVKVPVPGGLTSQSNVLALVQSNTGRIAVRAAVPNPASGKITIHFNAPAPAGTKVAWFVFG